MAKELLKYVHIKLQPYNDFSFKWEVTSWYYRIQESVTNGFLGLEFVLFLYEV